MKLLLDTHIALWAISDDKRLSAHARSLISDPDNQMLVSIASLWEIAIKHALRRGGTHAMPISAAQAESYFRHAGYELLDITAEHVLALEQLPPLHADPFDRLLVAQALSTPLRLLSHDAQITRYSDVVISA